MAVFTTQEAYLQGFQMTLQEAKEQESPVLKDYIQCQINRLESLVAQISQENFWQFLPEILGIDAKLDSVSELIIFYDFSNEDIIRIVEIDY